MQTTDGRPCFVLVFAYESEPQVFGDLADVPRFAATLGREWLEVLLHAIETDPRYATEQET